MSMPLKVFLYSFAFFVGILVEISKQDDFMRNFHQEDYKFYLERAELVRAHKDYLHDVKLTPFKYNRTCAAINASFTFKVDVGNDLEAVVQAYRFASNEYRLFPMRFQLNACETISKNVFGTGGLTSCGNFTGCPITKGRRYHVCNFTPDASRFPPHIPNGRYMGEVTLVYSNVEIAVFRVYFEITRPIVKK